MRINPKIISQHSHTYKAKPFIGTVKINNWNLTEIRFLGSGLSEFVFGNTIICSCIRIRTATVDFEQEKRSVRQYQAMSIPYFYLFRIFVPNDFNVFAARPTTNGNWVSFRLTFYMLKNILKRCIQQGCQVGVRWWWEATLNILVMAITINIIIVDIFRHYVLVETERLTKF